MAEAGSKYNHYPDSSVESGLPARAGGVSAARTRRSGLGVALRSRSPFGAYRRGMEADERSDHGRA
jgi:hypothetical protein